MKLTVENISRSFGGVQALLEVSFDVELGTIHGLIGPNGAGKTTLINILSGVLPPSMGQVLYQGLSLHHLPAHQVAALGVARTFQNIRLFPTMTCLENVLAGQHLTAERPLMPRLLRLPSAGREDRELEERARDNLAVLEARLPRGACLTASGAGWRSRAPWRSTPACSCWTNRWPACAGARPRKSPTSSAPWLGAA
jgi:branched-chain amino acid transport system ATP-binding protein